MDSFSFDFCSYLERVRLPEEPPPDLKGLTALQRAQFLAIPFENFDIQLGRCVDLEPAHLVDKLVHSPRGGYCFELNGLFLMALLAFAFEARPLLARIQLTGTPSGRGHQISLVEIQGRHWIADVGFGKDTPLGPLQLKLDIVQEHSGQPFRMIDGGKFGTMLQKLENGEWKNLYSFDMGHVCQADIAYGNHYTSTSPHSFFTTSRVAMRPFEGGWASLFNYTLTLVRNGQKETQQLPEGQGYLDALKAYFGIELDAPYEALKALKRE